MDLGLNLIETITNNFSEDQKIGSGGFGDVYKAVYNGTEIAVKKLHPLQGLDDKQFDSELRYLNKVSHKNVVSLLGYFYEARNKYIEHNGEIILAKSMERVLCFEYMQGGSLKKQIADDSCGLDWQTCYNIIRGTCEGLNHLHSTPENPIFHLDLKPSNILLDQSMTPKIADLGLSRLFASSYVHQTEILIGKSEYMPPEYLERRIISNKFDVFSFGVIIIKMLAGYSGYFRFSEMSPKEFIKLVTENWRKRLQAMPGLYSSHETEILQVNRCAELALRCVDKDGAKRPSFQDIINELEILEADIERILLPVFTNMGSKPNHLPLNHLRDITNNFCSERILGRGGFGVVYKGVLQNGNTIAIKKLVQSTARSQEQFENELNLLMKLENPNIVRLVGHCYDTQHSYMPHEGRYVQAWRTETFICLECLPN